MALTPLYNPHADLSQAEAALHLALDRGVRLLHTAQHYGDGLAFQTIRRVLQDRDDRDRLCVVAKIDGAPARVLDGPEGVRATLAGLGRERLDRVQLVESQPGLPDHWSLEAIMDDLERDGQLARILRDLRSAGAIGEVGIEAYTLEHVQRAVCIPGLEFVVADLSAIRQVVPPGAVPEPIRAGRVKLIAIRPLGGGWLTSRYRRLDDFHPDDNRRQWYAEAERYRGPVARLFAREGLGLVEGSLRFLHSLSYVETVVVGMRTVAHVAEALHERCSRPLERTLTDQVAALFSQPVVIEFD